MEKLSKEAANRLNLSVISHSAEEIWFILMSLSQNNTRQETLNTGVRQRDFRTVLSDVKVGISEFLIHCKLRKFSLWLQGFQCNKLSIYMYHVCVHALFRCTL